MDYQSLEIVSQLFARSAPIHVKGAILYNHLVKKNKLR